MSHPLVSASSLYFRNNMYQIKDFYDFLFFNNFSVILFILVISPKIRNLMRIFSCHAGRNLKAIGINDGFTSFIVSASFSVITRTLASVFCFDLEILDSRRKYAKRYKNKAKRMTTSSKNKFTSRSRDTAKYLFLGRTTKRFDFVFALTLHL